LATVASEELTILMPLAALRALPESDTLPVLFSLTVELLAASAEFSSPAAVTLSIWLSRRARVLVCFFSVDVFDLLWPNACPEMTKAATSAVVLTIFLTSSSTT
jgi:hypothetical protein